MCIRDRDPGRGSGVSCDCSPTAGGASVLDKCENCGHEGLIRDKGGTIAFRVSGPNGPQTKVIRGFEFRQCPMCGVMVPPWDLVERVAADPEVTNLDLDPPTYPEMSMDPPTTSNHVQIARYGTDFWNQCRLERSEVRPSLRGAFPVSYTHLRAHET